MKEHLFTWATGNQLLLGLRMLVWRLGGCPTWPLLSLGDIPALLPLSHQLSHPDPPHPPVLSLLPCTPSMAPGSQPSSPCAPVPISVGPPSSGTIPLGAATAPSFPDTSPLLHLRPPVPGLHVLLLKSHHQSPKCRHPVSQCSLLSFKLIYLLSDSHEYLLSVCRGSTH